MIIDRNYHAAYWGPRSARSWNGLSARDAAVQSQAVKWPNCWPLRAVLIRARSIDEAKCLTIWATVASTHWICGESGTTLNRDLAMGIERGYGNEETQFARSASACNCRST